MVLLFFFLVLPSWVASRASSLPSSVSVFTVISGQRSASSALTRRISALSNGTVVDWNELFGGHSSEINEAQTMDSSKFIPPDLFWAKCDDPVKALTTGLERWCALRGNRGKCAVVIKVFGKHCLNWKNKAAQLDDLLTYAGALPVILERDAAKRECSLTWAAETNDWGSTPELHAKITATNKSLPERPPCPENASDQFQAEHDKWFGHARTILKNATIPHIEIPAEAYTNGHLSTDDIALWVLRAGGF